MSLGLQTQTPPFGPPQPHTHIHTILGPSPMKGDSLHSDHYLRPHYYLGQHDPQVSGKE